MKLQFAESQTKYDSISNYLEAFFYPPVVELVKDSVDDGFFNNNTKTTYEEISSNYNYTCKKRVDNSFIEIVEKNARTYEANNTIIRFFKSEMNFTMNSMKYNITFVNGNYFKKLNEFHTSKPILDCKHAEDNATVGKTIFIDQERRNEVCLRLLKYNTKEIKAMQLIFTDDMSVERIIRISIGNDESYHLNDSVLKVVVVDKEAVGLSRYILFEKFSRYFYFTKSTKDLKIHEGQKVDLGEKYKIINISSPWDSLYIFEIEIMSGPMLIPFVVFIELKKSPGKIMITLQSTNYIYNVSRTHNTENIFNAFQHCILDNPNESQTLGKCSLKWIAGKITNQFIHNTGSSHSLIIDIVNKRGNIALGYIVEVDTNNKIQVIDTNFYHNNPSFKLLEKYTFQNIVVVIAESTINSTAKKTHVMYMQENASGSKMIRLDFDLNPNPGDNDFLVGYCFDQDQGILYRQGALRRRAFRMDNPNILVRVKPPNKEVNKVKKILQGNLTIGDFESVFFFTNSFRTGSSMINPLVNLNWLENNSQFPTGYYLKNSIASVIFGSFLKLDYDRLDEQMKKIVKSSKPDMKINIEIDSPLPTGKLEIQAISHNNANGEIYLYLFISNKNTNILYETIIKGKGTTFKLKDITEKMKLYDFRQITLLTYLNKGDAILQIMNLSYRVTFFNSGEIKSILPWKGVNGNCDIHHPINFHIYGPGLLCFSKETLQFFIKYITVNEEEATKRINCLMNGMPCFERFSEYELFKLIPYSSNPKKLMGILMKKPIQIEQQSLEKSETAPLTDIISLDFELMESQRDVIYLHSSFTSYVGITRIGLIDIVSAGEYIVILYFSGGHYSLQFYWVESKIKAKHFDFPSHFRFKDNSKLITAKQASFYESSNVDSSTSKGTPQEHFIAVLVDVLVSEADEKFKQNLCLIDLQETSSNMLRLIEAGNDSTYISVGPMIVRDILDSKDSLIFLSSNIIFKKKEDSLKSIPKLNQKEVEATWRYRAIRFTDLKSSYYVDPPISVIEKFHRKIPVSLVFDSQLNLDFVKNDASKGDIFYNISSEDRVAFHMKFMKWYPTFATNPKTISMQVENDNEVYIGEEIQKSNILEFWWDGLDELNNGSRIYRVPLSDYIMGNNHQIKASSNSILEKDLGLLEMQVFCTETKKILDLSDRIKSRISLKPWRPRSNENSCDAGVSIDSEFFSIRKSEIEYVKEDLEQFSQNLSYILKPETTLLSNNTKRSESFSFSPGIIIYVETVAISRNGITQFEDRLTLIELIGKSASRKTSFCSINDAERFNNEEIPSTNNSIKIHAARIDLNHYWITLMEYDIKQELYQNSYVFEMNTTLDSCKYLDSNEINMRCECQFIAKEGLFDKNIGYAGLHWVNKSHLGMYLVKLSRSTSNMTLFIKESLLEYASARVKDTEIRRKLRNENRPNEFYLLLSKRETFWYEVYTKYFSLVTETVHEIDIIPFSNFPFSFMILLDSRISNHYIFRIEGTVLNKLRDKTALKNIALKDITVGIVSNPFIGKKDDYTLVPSVLMKNSILKIYVNEMTPYLMYYEFNITHFNRIKRGNSMFDAENDDSEEYISTSFIEKLPHIPKAIEPFLDCWGEREAREHRLLFLSDNNEVYEVNFTTWIGVILSTERISSKKAWIYFYGENNKILRADFEFHTPMITIQNSDILIIAIQIVCSLLVIATLNFKKYIVKQLNRVKAGIRREAITMRIISLKKRKEQKTRNTDPNYIYNDASIMFLRQLEFEDTKSSYSGSEGLPDSYSLGLPETTFRSQPDSNYVERSKDKISIFKFTRIDSTKFGARGTTDNFQHVE